MQVQLFFIIWNTDESYNIYFQDCIQGTARGLYTQHLRDLVSTSYFGDMCRHIHNGYHLLPVKLTTLVAIGRIWKTLFLCMHILLKSYCRSSFKFTKSNRFCICCFLPTVTCFGPGIILEYFSSYKM